MRPLPDVRSWHLVTGEYPPQPGGVSDYTALVASALAAEVGTVHVWGPGDEPHPTTDGAVVVHRVAGRFGPVGLARLDRELDRVPSPRTVVIQYTPHAFGWKAMNLPFALWAASRRARGDDLRVMFHEVAFPWVRRPLRHNLIAAVNRLMAAVLTRACNRAYVAIPGWLPLLRRLGLGRKPTRWTAIPSTVPDHSPPDRVTARRRELTAGQPGAAVVGHFGTYGELVTTPLAAALLTLMDRRPEVRVLLLGGRGDRWRGELLAKHPAWADRVHAPGALPAHAVAEYLRACDLVVQPFPDGVSSRRTTVMAALANGVPVVTTLGHLSEPFWAEKQAVAAAAPEQLADVASLLSDDAAARAALGRRGRDLYERQFAIRHTVTALLDRPNAPA